MHRRTKKVLIVIAGIVVIIGGLYGVALIRANAKLRAAMRALAEDGRPMQAADLIPPEVPEAQNAAPLYLQAAQPLIDQAVTRRKNLLEHMGRLAFSIMGDTVDPNDLAELKELLAKDVVVSAMATVEQALQRPKCRFDYGYETGLDMDRTTFRDVRYLARIRAAQVYLEAQAGRETQAWDMILTQFKFADALRYEPTMMGQANHFGIVRDLCYVILALYDLAPPSESDWRKIDAMLRDHMDIGSLIYGADAERVLRGQWLFSLPRDRLYDALKRQKLLPCGNNASETVCRLTFRTIAFRPRFVADYAAYLEMMRDAVKVLEGPYAPVKGKIDREYQALAGRGILTRELSPYIVFDKDIFCGAVVKVNMTRAALGLMEYRRVHGAFPESLDALGLEGLTDPYIEAPLHYRTDNGGAMVYSVGEDQKDNGGKPEPPRDTSGRRQKKPVEFDLIWCYPKAAEQKATNQ